MARAVIFDGDDTLWLTEPLYDDARASARALVEAAGLDGRRWEALERAIDVGNVALMGHAAERFPTSCVQALDLVAAEAGVPCDDVLRRQVRAAAACVFTAPAPLRRHARKVLSELAARDLRLALLTKGVRAVQERRIAASGLAPLFDVVDIVDTKSASDFLSVVQRLDLRPADVAAVGNSVRSDVLPALAAGVEAIWLPAHVWEYERAHDHLLPDGMATITELDELLDVLPP